MRHSRRLQSRNVLKCCACLLFEPFSCLNHPFSSGSTCLDERLVRRYRHNSCGWIFLLIPEAVSSLSNGMILNLRERCAVIKYQVDVIINQLSLCFLEDFKVIKNVAWKHVCINYCEYLIHKMYNYAVCLKRVHLVIFIFIITLFFIYYESLKTEIWYKLENKPYMFFDWWFI